MKKTTMAATVLFAVLAHACHSPVAEEDEATATSAIGGAMTATVFGTGGQGLRVRAEPTTASAQLDTVSDGARVTVLCQTRGLWVDGTDVWDRIDSPRGYVSDAYVRTGVNGFHPDITRCDGTSAPSKSPPPAQPGASTTSRGFASIWGGGSAPITSEYNESNGLALYDYGRAYGLDGVAHTGIDVGIAAGTRLYAPMGGKIVCVGGNGSSPDGSSCGFFGDSAGGVGRIQISLDDGSQLILGHCRSAVVGVGQRVEAGQHVGTSGSMNGPHVHVELRVKGGGTSSGWRLVDPRTRL